MTRQANAPCINDSCHRLLPTTLINDKSQRLLSTTREKTNQRDATRVMDLQLIHINIICKRHIDNQLFFCIVCENISS